MPLLRLETFICAPVGRCFDLSRSVEAHLASAAGTGERAVGGVTSGLLGPGDEITWRARHFGLPLSLTSRITGYDRPRWFRDSMVRGPFARFDHDHFFDPAEGGTLVRDVFDYASPLGPLGRLADLVAVERHMRDFLARRNEHLRELAESARWADFVAPE
jgi:ligand-binding SRPBCC domain-containing protein